MIMALSVGKDYTKVFKGCQEIFGEFKEMRLWGRSFNKIKALRSRLVSWS
jgi:hypothetical protein